MIPKTIAYGWFGGNLKPDRVKKCIDSWYKHCPDYQIIELNEEICPIEVTQWTQSAFSQKKWAFVADYFRMWYMYHHGGITLDADVELIAPLDKFLEHQFFSGQEINDKVLITATMGSVPKHPFVEMVLAYYKLVKFNPEPNTKFLTNLIKSFPMAKEQKTIYFPSGVLYPQHIFCPFNHRTRQIVTSPDTVAIHHFLGSWKHK